MARERKGVRNCSSNSPQASVAGLTRALDLFAHRVKPLDPPDTIEGDPKATEMLRLWAAHDKLNVAINVGCYEETGHDEAKAWRIMIAHFARLVCRALQQRYGKDPNETLQKIKDTFLAEVNEPTSEIDGE